jgi:hypothetical protein
MCVLGECGDAASGKALRDLPRTYGGTYRALIAQLFAHPFRSEITHLATYRAYCAFRAPPRRHTPPGLHERYQ